MNSECRPDATLHFYDFCAFPVRHFVRRPLRRSLGVGGSPAQRDDDGSALFPRDAPQVSTSDFKTLDPATGGSVSDFKILDRTASARPSTNNNTHLRACTLRQPQALIHACQTNRRRTLLPTFDIQTLFLVRPMGSRPRHPFGANLCELYHLRAVALRRPLTGHNVVNFDFRP